MPEHSPFPKPIVFLAVFLVLCLILVIPSAKGQQLDAATSRRLQTARSARDRQDLPGLKSQAEAAERLAESRKSAVAHYAAARIRSYEAEVALELADKSRAADAAEKGIRHAELATTQAPKNAEYHRILGVLCGQVIPANLLLGIRYGTCARDEIETALRLDPRSPEAYLGRGVGNYYLPEAFGGGIAKAIQDFRYATSLDPNLSEGWLWLGLALRKQGNHREAREALDQAHSLAPERKWIETQIAKTPK